jgi:predicted house-cleaning noncanonical NTP pyrophosphatase (MazG superfamily)
MYFTGVEFDGAQRVCLPWFCTAKVVSSIIQTTGVRFSGRRVDVFNLDDVRSLSEQFNAGELKKPFSIRLRPEPSLLRSAEFLREVGRVATAADVAVELEGSILSHCYYVLRQDGVKVTCVDALEAPATRRRFGKLVRDKIPLRIESHGETPIYLNVTADELLHLLKAKAVEESLELFWEAERSRVIEELTDLLEVIESISRICGKSLEDLISASQAKRADRGGFQEGVVLLQTQSVPLITRELKEYGLFEDTDRDDTRKSGPTRASGKRVDYRNTRRPKADTSGVVISLVPPDPAYSRKDSVVLLPDGLIARIRYDATDVRVAVSRHARRAVDPRQLHFSFYEVDD